MKDIQLRNYLITIVLWGLFCIALIIFFCVSHRQVVIVEKTDTIYIDQSIRFDTMEANINNMLEVCNIIGIKYPEIVVTQAILESNYFKSNLFINNNNPLGLYNSSRHQYYYFNHWTHALFAYQLWIESRYRDGEDYYDFLDRIRYAEDSTYTDKLKILIKNINNND